MLPIDHSYWSSFIGFFSASSKIITFFTSLSEEQKLGWWGPHGWDGFLAVVKCCPSQLWLFVIWLTCVWIFLGQPGLIAFLAFCSLRGMTQDLVPCCVGVTEANLFCCCFILSSHILCSKLPYEQFMAHEYGKILFLYKICFCPWHTHTLLREGRGKPYHGRAERY